MPKMKTKSAAKKRFKITASGKIKRACSGKNHILTKKDRKRKNRLCEGAYVDATQEITLQSYVKGYVKSKFGIKSEDFDLVHSQNTTAAVIDEMINHNTEE